MAGTIELRARNLRIGGIIPSGEPTWRQVPPKEDVAKRFPAHAISDVLVLPEPLASFDRLGYDAAQMVPADRDARDGEEEAKWLAMRRRPEVNPHDELAKEVRARGTAEPVRYAAYARGYLGRAVLRRGRSTPFSNAGE